MDESRVLEAMQEMDRHGYGQVTVKFDKNGARTIIMEKLTLNPTDVEIEKALDNTLAWGFGSVEKVETAGIVILKQIRKRRI